MVLALERPTSTNDPPRPESKKFRRPRRQWIGVAVALAYLAAAAAIMGSLWVSPSGRTFAVNSSDQTLFEWMLVHGLRVFTHGDNPLGTGLLNAPLGVNLMVNTSMLGLSLPFAPLTAWLGPSVVFVLLLTLGLAGTAYAWYHVLYHYFLADRIAAIVGGAICGFGPGIIAHSAGHPNITAQFLVPLILWRVLALRHTTRPWRDGAILAALIVLQTFINEEVLLDIALAGTVFVIAYVAMHPAALRDSATRMLRGLGIGVLIGAPLIAYPIWYEFTAPGHVNGLPLNLQDFPYRLPLVSYVTLPGRSWWGDPVSNLRLAHAAEENSFLGWPVVIVALAIVVVLWRRSPAVRALSIVGAVFAYASLGNRVTIADPQVSYPYSLWSHLDSLPVFNSILPSRLGLVVLPVIGLLFANGIAHARRAWADPDRPPRTPRTTIANPMPGIHRQLRLRWLAPSPRTERRAKNHRKVVRATSALGLVAIAASLVTIVPRQPATVAREPVPAFFTDGTWRHYVPTGYTVLTATPVDRVANMRWSVATGLAFGIPGGYYLGPDATGRARFGPVPRPTMSLLTSAERGTVHKIRPATVAQAIVDVRYWRTAIVVLTPGHPYGGNTLVTLNALFGPAVNVDGVWIWNVRPLTDGPAASFNGVAARGNVPLPAMLR